MLAASGTNLDEMQEAINRSGVRVWHGHSGGAIDVINLLIEMGLDVNEGSEDDYTPLMAASHAGVTPVVKLLIQKGASVSAKTKGDWTALMSAATSDHEWRSSMELLLQHGADINAKTKDSWTALAIASFHKGFDQPIVKFLKSRGAKE